MGTKKLKQNLQDWVVARERFHISHAHVQMARELGMNPKKLGKLDNSSGRRRFRSSSSTCTSRGSAESGRRS